MTKLSAALAVGLVTGLVSVAGQASTLTLSYNYAFSGDSPGGSTPWIVSTFDDHGSAGSVTLTMSLSGLTSSENVSGMYFNLDPSLNPASLTFTHAGGVTASSITGSADAYKADGDGKYDILFSFPTGSGFNAGDTSTYTISGISSLTANSFDFGSAPGSVGGGGTGSYLAAAHVQNTPGSSGSGWVAPVPLPAAVWLFGSGLMGLVGVTRRQRVG